MNIEVTSSKKSLYHYYKNENHAFLIHLEETKKNPNKKNIHQIRVDIKKLRTFFYLLEMLFPENFIAKDHSLKFKPLFKNAGKIRETQINEICLKHYKLSPSTEDLYLAFSNRKQKKFNKKLHKSAVEFDADFLKKLKSQVKKLCDKTDEIKTEEVCKAFIKKETQMIEELLIIGDNPVVIHKIRMHLKSIAAIGSFFYTINPELKLKETLTHVKQSDTLIGEWHDKIILEKSLEKFVIKNKKLSPDEFTSYIKLLKEIEKENQFFFIEMNGKVNAILKLIQDSCF